MYTGSVVALLCALVLVASALPEPIRALSEVEYGPYAFHATSQVPITASDYLSAGDVPESLEIINEDPEPGDKTIYQILNAIPHFSKLAKVVNISDDIVSLLNDSSAGITFFAVPDWALKRPGHRHPSPHRREAGEDPHRLPEPLEFVGEDKPYDLTELVSAVEGLEDTESLDEPNKGRRKKFLKKIVTAILAYHILPGGLDSQQLAQNHTFATNLTLPDGSLDKEPLRVRIQKVLLPPKLNVNLYSQIVKPNIRAKNGIIHVVNHPLLPPPSVFQEMFILPSAFSFLTSGLQRVGLTSALDFRYVHGKDKKGTLEGTPVVTLFAPTNRAFKRLPYGLRLYLFSPFGERALKKLLEFHVVPELVVHSDYFYNASSHLTENRFSFWQGTEKQSLSGLGQLDLEAAIFGPGWNENWVCEEDFGEFDQYDCMEELDEDMEVHPSFDDPCPYPEEGPSNSGPSPPFSGSHWHGSSPPQNAPGGPAPPPHGPQPPWGPRSRMTVSPVYAANLTLPSLLANHTHFVQISKYKFKLPIPGPRKENYVTNVIVDGQSVVLSDLVARNGAVHVLGKLLDPRPRHRNQTEGFDDCHRDHSEYGWEDWEDWLPQWAAAN